MTPPIRMVSVPVDEYGRLIEVCNGLIAELSDPGTEALAAVYCAERILHLTAAPVREEGGAVDWDAKDQELIERGLRTIRTHDAVRYLRDALSATTARLAGYDWNADPDGVTKQQGDAFAAADRVFADLDAAVASHPEIELPECQTCGGTGKIEEAARTTGANQHSACVRTCDDCDGCGFAPDDDPPALATREEAPAEAGEVVETGNGPLYDLIAFLRPEFAETTKQHLARRTSDLLRAQPQARSGKVTWHSSGEDEGPDVGLQLDIGGGCSLWLGEGKKPTGWQIAIVHDDEIVPVADVIDHEQARELFDRIASAVQPQAREDAQPVALPLEGAPRDGTMLRLRVRYEAANQDEAWTPLEDSEESWTIGFNNFDNTGDDRWQFVGWDWSQDHLLEATGGAVIGWLPFHTHLAPDALRVAVEALKPFAYFAKHGTSREYINSDAPDDGLCAAASFPAGAYRGAVKALAALQAEQGAK